MAAKGTKGGTLAILACVRDVLLSAGLSNGAMARLYLA